MSAEQGRARYQQIAEDLRAKVSSGVYVVGSPLPSTAKLMEKYDVSSTVVQRALRELKHDGILEGQPGRAVFVRREPEPEEPSQEYLEVKHLVDDLRESVEDSIREMSSRLDDLEQAVRRLRDRRQDS